MYHSTHLHDLYASHQIARQIPFFRKLSFARSLPRSTNRPLSQIEENTRALEYLGQTWGSQSSLESLSTQGSAASERKRISSEKWKQGARKTLLQWVTNALPKSVSARIIFLQAASIKSRRDCYQFNTSLINIHYTMNMAQCLQQQSLISVSQGPRHPSS